MHTLTIYPTSRALRTISEELKSYEGFLPTLMRMDEFERCAMLLPDRVIIDPLQRILFLYEAADFMAFSELKVDRELIRFFTKSTAIFKFFEELAQEGVNFSTLAGADAYAEFEKHLGILETLFNNYQRILEERGLTDKAFIPTSYRLNEGFIQGYESIEIYLEGYLSRYELDLIVKIAQIKPLVIHYVTSRFNLKMQERFKAYGITLPQDSFVSFDLGRKQIVETRKNLSKLYAKVFQVEERYEQISVAFEQIDLMVRSGIKPESIALILPDESIKESIAFYDRLHNLNFAMGFDYEKSRAYKRLEALYGYWKTFNKESRYLLEQYGLVYEKISTQAPTVKCPVVTFFDFLIQADLLDCVIQKNEESFVGEQGLGSELAFEKYAHFLKLFDAKILSMRDWLFLWMKALSTLTIDDVHGGKITVMGVLETRGVCFDAVVIMDFNEGVVPATSSKDQFLSSLVRTFAGLPTQSDRESLQKQYYKRLLEQAKQAVILYCSSENRLPSKFLYELGLEKGERMTSQLSLLYDETTQIKKIDDPVVVDFDATAIVWSPSRLKTYLECKRKYYYCYIQKIKAKEEDKINEGAFLHILLEHLYREKNHYESTDTMRITIDRLLDSLLPGNDAKTAYHKLLWKEKLKGFIEAEVRHFEAGWRVVEREYEVMGEIGGLRFKGRIDRIDQDATGTLVLDYKSGATLEANKTKNLETLNDFQMSIYHTLLSPQYQNITLAFVKILENGTKEEIAVLEEKNKFLAEHIGALKQTDSFVASKCEELKKCSYCEFSLMCERGVYL